MVTGDMIWIGPLMFMLLVAGVGLFLWWMVNEVWGDE